MEHEMTEQETCGFLEENSAAIPDDSMSYRFSSAKKKSWKYSSYDRQKKTIPSQHRLVTADISNDAVQNIILDILQGGEKPELAITFVGGGHENLLTDKIRDSITHCISSDYKPEISEESSELQTFSLDPNMDYYCLVDEGLETRPDVGFISKFNTVLMQDLAVPCVMVLAGGGKWSLEVMHKFLFQQKESSSGKGRPVVIIMNGSGKLADLLSSIYEYYQWKYDMDVDQEIKSLREAFETDPEHDGMSEEQLEMKIKNVEDAFFESAISNAQNKYMANYKKDRKTKKLFRHLIADINNTKSYKEIIKECVRKKMRQIFIFESEHGAIEDLEPILFRAVIASKPNERIRFLFALRGNESKFIREYVIAHRAMAFDVMNHAILKSVGLTRVKRLLELHEFDITEYVNQQILRLYEVNTVTRCRTTISEVDTNELRNFYAKHTQTVKTDDGNEVKALKVDGVMKDLSNGNTSNKIHTVLASRITVNYKIINPIQALLINSILFLDVNAARLFWHFDERNPLSNAVLLYVLLRGLKKKAKDVYKSSPIVFEDSLKHFESMTCTLLDTYYKTSKDMTERVLWNKQPLWNDQTLIEMARGIGLQFFLKKKACGSSQEKAWKKVVYLSTLLAFAFFVLFTNTVAHEPIKWTVMAVVISMVVDEIRQVTDMGNKFCHNIKQWATSIWNLLDFVTFVLFFLGFGFSYYDKYASNIIFSTYLSVSWIRALQFFRRPKTLGVYLALIRMTIKRMHAFFLVFFVSIMGYGMFMTSLLHPNTTLDWRILFNILFRPYLLLFGEVGIESFQVRTNGTVFGTPKVRVASEILVVLGMAAFLLFSNVLLVNLLIADFSSLHKEVSESSEEIWMYEQYDLLQEFKRKPMLPIPFSIFENCCYLLSKICKRKGKEKLQDDAIEYGEPEDITEREKIAKFEKMCFKKIFLKLPDDFT